MSDTMMLPDGYAPSRVRTPKPRIACRAMSLQEAKALDSGSHIEFRSVNGDLRTCKVNGAPKVWKTRPLDVDVPVKYGMYEFSTFTMRGGEWRDTAYPVVRIKE